ncbi:MAG: hypothetical protein MZV70_37375 [Desulfobacterales bacterium]|nr:hypothetical protein [Desulfobacterales bacterium]
MKARSPSRGARRRSTTTTTRTKQLLPIVESRGSCTSAWTSRRSSLPIGS